MHFPDPSDNSTMYCNITGTLLSSLNDTYEASECRIRINPADINNGMLASKHQGMLNRLLQVACRPRAICMHTSL